MRPFAYERANDLRDVSARLAEGGSRQGPPTGAAAQILAGGTTLVDLMKLDVMTPARLVDINGVGDLAAVSRNEQGLRLGALARMSDIAARADLQRDFPVIAQTLLLAASPQLRNMATLGGNVLQRTRCTYFRDISWQACNKRSPGSGCAAMEGFNRSHAVLGVSDACIAAYPGDFAQALIALDAAVEIASARGSRRTLPFADLHRAPGDQPEVETRLAPDDVITAFLVPEAPWTRRSRYVKVRDRQSYEFALTSAAIALDMDGGRVREARIALGGVATRPWRASAAEAALKGREINEDSAREAGEIAFREAVPHKYNAFKIALGKETVARALLETAAMEI